ncbi:acyl-CoA thioesterase [Kitasatospora phosalacinea]|uniref:Acyl-CoA thioesterase n=1 Tax=Kitasatospora phosalacinea TaxID=2065 RepID=A0ABW6GJJ4_9ACTN
MPLATTGMDSLLRLSRAGEDLFQGWCHHGAPGRGFGGLTAAQALVAAGLTVRAGQLPHSLHGYFLSAVDPERPVGYQVERVRNGHAYATRRVTARQGDRQAFTLTASFKLPERTTRRHGARPAAPDPAALPNLLTAWRLNGGAAACSSLPFEVLDLRLVGRADTPAAEPGRHRQHVWLRAAQPLPDEGLLHAAALVYGSDLLFAPTAALDVEDPAPVRTTAPRTFMTSLDHAVWFHRPPRLDDWLLFDQRSPAAGDGRGLVQGELWSREGELVASVAQEAVLRPLR